MFGALKAKHKHLVEHKNARKRVVEGLYEAIWPDNALGQVLQHGCYSLNL